MTQLTVISGFLGAGKTTLIKKLIAEAYPGEKLVLLENEYGEVGIDGGFMKDSGIEVTELNSGCICCTMAGDFKDAIETVVNKFAPDRVIVEPSGVGKLSEVLAAIEDVKAQSDIKVSGCATVVDAQRAKMYKKNFGEFFTDQINTAFTVVLSRTQFLSQDKLEKAVELVKDINPKAKIITTPWDELSCSAILSAMSETDDLIDMEEIMKNHKEHAHHHHHHHHHDHDEHCECGEHEHHHHHDHDEHCECEEHEHHHHHDHDEHCECEEHEHHHHHDHDEHCECEEHEHHHHHDHDEHCECGEHEHHHHHHHEHGEKCTCGCCDGDHDADEVFETIGIETVKRFNEEKLNAWLNELENEEEYGLVIRAKGIVMADDNTWLHYDYVPGEMSVRHGAGDYTGRLCFIGAELNEKAIKKLFEL